MSKKIIAGAAAAGAAIGAGIGDKLSPVKYVGTPDMSWHINNNDGTVANTLSAVHALNESGNHTAMAVGAGLGAIAAGVAVHKALKNRHNALRSEQFDK
jgi:membrane peptidoglycan carboxypeptidase